VVDTAPNCVLFISVPSLVLACSLLINERDDSLRVHIPYSSRLRASWGLTCVFFSCHTVLDGNLSECEQLAVGSRTIYDRNCGFVLFSAQQLYSAGKSAVCSTLISCRGLPALPAVNDVDVSLWGLRRFHLEGILRLTVFKAILIN